MSLNAYMNKYGSENNARQYVIMYLVSKCYINLNIPKELTQREYTTETRETYINFKTSLCELYSNVSLNQIESHYTKVV